MGELNINFKDSVEDLVFLLSRDYPKKSAIQLVGNRYQLCADGMSIMFTAVPAGFEDDIRRSKDSPVLLTLDCYASQQYTGLDQLDTVQ